MSKEGPKQTCLMIMCDKDHQLSGIHSNAELTMAGAATVPSFTHEN
jgi:hypothetical protein